MNIHWIRDAAIRRLAAAAAAGVILVVTPLRARADDRWYVSPFIGAQFGADAPRTSPVVGVSAGWLGAHLGGEFDLGYGPEFFARTGFRTERRLTTVMGNVLAPIPWGRTRMFTPYGVFGLGALKPGLADAGGLFAVETNKFGMDAGAGVLSMVNGHVGVRGDVRYFRGLTTNADDGAAFGLDLSAFHFWRVSAGVVARF